MAVDPWQMTGSGADSYERYQVPSVFGPLVRIFLERVALTPGQHVLDVACGTGILARLAAPMLGPSGLILGVDLNASMLEVARSLAPKDGARVEWRHGDATALPCEEAAFDIVLCQQGLQFFPDRPGALSEMRRVLKPRGRVGLCVWRGIENSPCHAAIAQALHRHVGAAVAARFQAPFGFGDRDALHAVMRGAGFIDIDIQVATVIRGLLQPEESIPGLLASTPIGPDIAALDLATREAIVAETAAALDGYRDADGFVVPQPTHIAFGRR